MELVASSDLLSGGRVLIREVGARPFRREKRQDSLVVRFGGSQGDASALVDSVGPFSFLAVGVVVESASENLASVVEFDQETHLAGHYFVQE